MKKVILQADLSLVSKNHQILITNQGKDLMVNIIGKSVLYIPFRQLLTGYTWRKKSKYLDQLIQLQNNGKNLLKLKKGNIRVENYPALLKLIIRSLLGK